MIKLVAEAIWSNFSDHKPIIIPIEPKIKEPSKVKIEMYKKLWNSNSTIKLNTKIQTKAIITLLVQAAKVMAKVISPAVRGAYKISTILPWILPIIIEEEEWEKACCITCIAINPGARKVINGKPKTSPLSLPIARERTIKNKREVTSGDITVCMATIKNLKTSFL